MISISTIKKILGIKEDVCMDDLEMVKKITVTFYPNKNKNKNNDDIIFFSNKLKETLVSLGVNIIEFDSIWTKVPFKKRSYRFFKYLYNDIIWFIRKLLNLPEKNYYIPIKSIIRLCSKKIIKRNIHIICEDEQDVDELPMQYISSFKSNSIINIVNFPIDIDKNSDFSKHFDKSMSLFAYHMANIIIAVDKEKWMLYNFNGSHPIYPLKDEHLKTDILKSLIPKLAAPVCPHKYEEFTILDNGFNINDNTHEKIIKNMIDGSKAFNKTNLYPKGKKIDDLPFRSNLHKLIGKLHLDSRNGMSFGYLAFQMPTKLYPVQTMEEFTRMNKLETFHQIEDEHLIDQNSNIFIVFKHNEDKYVMKIPEVWVMTIRSGANKTDFNPNKDLIKIGLKNGDMYMQFPLNAELDNKCKPSFDTKVILAHAVGNAMAAQLFKYLNVNNKFINDIQDNGYSISHWHGYFNKDLIPKGVIVYGHNNPHVSCSSPQSSIFALKGKLDNIILENHNNHYDFQGDIHIEPHHGINFSYPNLTLLAEYILNNPNSTQLGNKYL